MGVKLTKKYEETFKKEAVQLTEEIGVTETARKLGIPTSTLWCWKNHNFSKEQKELSYKELLEENKKLKKDLKEHKVINEILKKTAALFCKDHL